MRLVVDSVPSDARFHSVTVDAVVLAPAAVTPAKSTPVRVKRSNELVTGS